MKVKLHNKLEVLCGEKIYTFYNQMTDAVFDAIENLSNFNSFVAVGNGMPNNNEKTQKLSNFIKKYALNDEILQNNIAKGDLFVKKSLVVDEYDESFNNITEIGFCKDDENNPDVYNYITLISEDFPNGLNKIKGEKLIINLYIYLELEPLSEGLFCAGENPLISFLLGEGLNPNLYAVRGNNLCENILTTREILGEKNMFKADIFMQRDDGVDVIFEADLRVGETDEILFVLDDKIVARINVLNIKNPIQITSEFVSDDSKTIDLGKDVCLVESVFDKTKNEQDLGFCEVAYANAFGDKSGALFSGIFDYQTPRFVSKDGKFLFFVKDDYVYGYKNQNSMISEILTSDLFLQNIKKIVSFDNLVFMILKFEPYLKCFKIVEDRLEEVEFDLSDFEYYSELETVLDVDFVRAKNDKILMGFILPTNKGITAYFDYNVETDRVSYDESLESNYAFSYLVGIHKNSYCDGLFLFIKEAEFDYQCRIVTHFADKTLEDVATLLAYDLIHNAKEIYARGRAVVAERLTSPKIDIFFYPELVDYLLPQTGEVDDYFSSDLLYFVQKFSNSTYKIYNLIGYNQTSEFDFDISDLADETQIAGFEFFGDILLIFLNDEEKTILAVNLKQDRLFLENVSGKQHSFEISYKKYNKLGANNKGVKASLRLNIRV